MPSSIKLTEPLDILVEYGYLDDDTPYHKAVSNAVNDFSSDKTLGGKYNRDYINILQKEASKELKLRRKKIDVKSFKENFLNKEEPIKADTKGTSSLPPTPDPDLSVEKEEDKETEGLKGIRDVLDEILGILRLDFKGDRNEAREARKNAAAQMRKDKEDKLESKKDKFGVGKAVKAMVAPFMSIWEKLLNFLKLTFIGVLFNTVFKWFSNPENEKKVKAIGKFFKDWWPALSFAAIAFLTPFGALVAGAVSLLTSIIPKIVMAIAANPWSALALVGTGLAVWGISKLASQPDETTQEVDESVDEIGKEETIDQLKEEQENRGFMGKIGDFFTGAGAEREQQIERLEGMDNEGEGGDGTTTERTSDSFTTRGGPEADQLQNQMAESRGEETQEFKQGGMVHNFNQVNSARNIVKKYNEGGLVNNYNYGGGQVQNFNLGGIVQKYNEGGIVQKYNEGGIVQKYNEGGIVQKYNQGGLVRNYNNVVKNYKQGGFVSGPGGVDKVPARLTAGEFVMSKGAVQKFGANTLASMNAAGGGSNIPTITQEYMEGGSVQYFAGGGRVESTTTKEPVEIPQLQSKNRTITLPTIKKKGEEQRNTTKNDIPDFRIPIISTQRSMILSSLGIQDLIGGE